MNIIKSMQAGILHRSYEYQGKCFFTASLLWGFQMDSGEPVMEYKLWAAISEKLGKNEMFDAAMPKTCGEVLAFGSFFSPGAKPVLRGSVSISIAAVHKELSVFGNRYWKKTPGIKGPEPFTEMPVSYTNAFGGEGYDKNPAGKGFAPVETEEGKFHPLPNIEYPNQMIVYPGDRPEPAAFSRLDIMCLQRFAKAGTYNKKYIRERMPGLPDDIDWEYFNEAPPDQWVEGYFRGDEAFEIVHMHPKVPVQQGNLPGVYGRCFVMHEENEDLIFKEMETRLDTVCFFPKENLGVLIHRGVMEVNEDDGTDIRQILIAHENLTDSPRSLQHYQDELTKRTDPEEGFKYMMYTKPLIPEGCRCGFEIIKEESPFPIEHLTRKNAETYSGEKQKEMQTEMEKAESEAEKQKEEAVRKLKEADIVPPEELTKPLDISGKAPPPSPESEELKRIIDKIAPGVMADPENFDVTTLNLKAFDELNEYTSRMTAQKKKEARERLESELKNLEEMREAPQINRAAEKIENAIREMDLPPVLPRMNAEYLLENFREQIAEARKKMMLMHSMGIPEEQLAKFNTLDFEETEKQIREGVEKAKDGYRMGAHYIEEARSPHEGKEAEIAADLRKNYGEGGETADGDYAFCDLSGLDLSGIDLSGAYLEYANLRNSNLTGANLSNAILAHANLTNTNLSNTNLSGANLGASLMDNAVFTDADLSGAILGKAKIRNAKFHRCKLTGRMEMFLESEFENADFTGSDMRRNNFIDADISGCCFAECDLSESNFLNPKMEGTVFDRALLQSVNFVKTEGSNCSFIETSMKNVRFVGGCILNNARFNGAYAPEANFRDCQMDCADFTEAFLHKSDFGGSGLVRAKFIRADAVQAQFSKANLVYADLHRINLMEGSMLKTRLSGAKLTQANLYSVTFLRSIIGEDGIEDAVFTDAYM